jgi:hypothetical protein
LPLRAWSNLFQGQSPKVTFLLQAYSNAQFCPVLFYDCDSLRSLILSSVPLYYQTKGKRIQEESQRSNIKSQWKINTGRDQETWESFQLVRG